MKLPTRQPAPPVDEVGPAVGPPAAPTYAARLASAAPWLACGALLLLLGAGLGVSWLSVGAVAATEAIALLGLNIVWGRLGLMNLGQNGFFAVGAYATALMTTHLHQNPLLGIPVGFAAAGLLGYALAQIVLRQTELYFALTTLGFGLITAAFITAAPTSFAGGSVGIYGIPSLSIGSWHLGGNWSAYLMVWIVAVVLAWLTARSGRSRVGLSWRVIADHPAVASAVGVDVTRTRTRAFVLSTLFASLGGSLFAQLSIAISPGEFDLSLLITLLTMFIAGGMGSALGAVVGAVVLSLVVQASGTAGNSALIVYGLVFIVILLAAPKGLVGLFNVAVRSAWVLLRRRLHDVARAEPSAALVAGLDGTKMGKRAAATRLTAVASTEGGALEVSGIDKSFGGMKALVGVSLIVPAGHIYGIAGANGAGKSTLLDIICGFRRADCGRVMFAGTDMTGLAIHQRAVLGVARTFQKPSLVLGMTAAENVAIGAYQRGHCGLWSAFVGRGGREYDAQLDDAVDMLTATGLGSLAHRPCHELSFGQLRIVEIARAIVQRPRLLLLDEPTSGLGRDDKDFLSALLKELQTGGMSVCLIEHDTELLASLCDRIMVLDRGRVIADTVAAEVFRDPEVVRSYVGSAADEVEEVTGRG